MRKLIIMLILALSGIALPAMAQRDNKCARNDKMWSEMQEFKMKFLAQEMDLREDQQKRFFELYGQMSAEKRRLFQETKALEKKLKADKNATDAEYAAVSRALTSAKEKDAEIEKRYDEKFSTFLSAKQIFKMKAAEDKFRNKLHELRHKGRVNRKGK